MPVPELLTPRLRLRPLTPADADPLYELLRHPDAARFLPFPVTRELVRDHVEELLAADNPDGLGSYSWEDRETGEFVGHGDLRPCEETGDGRVEMGWYLLSARQGRGLATEAARAVLDHAYGTVGVDQVIALVHEENEPSVRIARRLGFVEESRGTYYGGPHILFARSGDD
ncbi:GNAT family N-acetyltransferase [Streptoalloteichus hindustanus]|uniref:Protein N-acetyltransferase, RimJ/RimL family n=1 Tax=Streptoalloteichus hindustanus TaxID=2017 RepID=A0A1M5B5V8_STRHI|nr:GNAT family N-acetyltransferase [Streptoalloteichus hindustanus]SHF37667.1 Protein N-acetyltransferase, RimJ/RimL family [Streptoalloteichus hindustanus]